MEDKKEGKTIFDKLFNPELWKEAGEKIKEMDLFTGTPEIALAGQTNAGKTELINALFAGEINLPSSVKSDFTKEEARVFHEKLGITFIDLPGMAGEILNPEKAFITLADLDPHVLLHLIPAFSGPLNEDIRFRQIIRERGVTVPVITVISQSDILSSEDEKLEVLEDVCTKLQVEKEEVVFTSSKTGEGLDGLVEIIFDVLPSSAGVGFAKALAGFLDVKREAANRVITRYTLLSTAVGASPIPFSDMPILVALQVGMIRQIEEIYGVDTTLSREIIASGGGGYIFREIARQLSKIFPGASVINATIAGMGTYTIGKVALIISEKRSLGEKVDLDTIKEVLNKVKESAKKEFDNLFGKTAGDLPDEARKEIEKIRYLIDSGAISEEEGLKRIEEIRKKYTGDSDEKNR